MSDNDVLPGGHHNAAQLADEIQIMFDSRYIPGVWTSTVTYNGLFQCASFHMKMPNGQTFKISVDPTNV